MLESVVNLETVRRDMVDDVMLSTFWKECVDSENVAGSKLQLSLRT